MTIEAIFENGVLRPLHPVSLREQERVTIEVVREGEWDWLDSDYAEPRAARTAVPIEEVRRRLSKIKGSIDEAIDEDRGEH